MSLVVGPSGIFSTASNQRGFCSAQKYGPVKISCMQRICTPSLPAWSPYLRVRSIGAFRLVSLDSSVPAAREVWIKQQFSGRDIESLLGRDGREAYRTQDAVAISAN